MPPSLLGTLPLRARALPFCSHATSILASAPAQLRCLHAQVKMRPIPEPTPFCPDPATFLTLIGRQLSQHASKIPTWDALFTLTPTQLRELGIDPPRTRKYLLTWRERFRRGEFGIGGDCKHVDGQGRAELRIVEVPVGSKIEEAAWVLKHGEGATRDTVPRATGAKGSLNATPGMRRIVVNIPVSAGHLVGPQPAAAEAAAAETPSEDAGEQAQEVLDGAEVEVKDFRDLTPEELDLSVPIGKVKINGVREILGSHVRPVKGTKSLGGLITVKEGLWEIRRGHKVDGGERRKAEVRAKRAAAARRAAAR